jgi:tetratricopeptide (TPR) repeat protein
VAYWKLQQFDKSTPLMEEVLRLHRKVHGEGHPLTIGAMANVAVNYRDAGRLEEAVSLLERAHKDAGNDASLQWVGRELWIAYQRAGRPAQAATLIMELLDKDRKSLPANSPQLAALLAQNGGNLLQLRAWSDAESVLRECLTIRANNEPDDWRVFSTMSALGEALHGQKDYPAAESMLLHGYEGMKRREAELPPQEKEMRLSTARERLVRLYEAWDKPEEAARWRRLLPQT